MIKMTFICKFLNDLFFFMASSFTSRQIERNREASLKSYSCPKEWLKSASPYEKKFNQICSILKNIIFLGFLKLGMDIDFPFGDQMSYSKLSR
jgi:hypothetical protein